MEFHGFCCLPTHNTSCQPGQQWLFRSTRGATAWQDNGIAKSYLLSSSVSVLWAAGDVISVDWGTLVQRYYLWQARSQWRLSVKCSCHIFACVRVVFYLFFAHQNMKKKPSPQPVFCGMVWLWLCMLRADLPFSLTGPPQARPPSLSMAL